jgi:recombinational DNA repair protein (RecF pathway)
MPAQSLTTDAFVLLKREPTDAFQSFAVFSPEHGALTVLQRRSKKSSSTGVVLDLFDEATLLLESSNQGRTWFVKEARLVTRHADLGRGYETLRHASALAALIARNPVHEDSRTAVAALLRAALAAFAAGARPDLVFFKSLYRFARDEGYAVKQQWLPTLPRDLRTDADLLLRTPVAGLETSAFDLRRTALLTRCLEDYLRGHTEILLD